MFTIPEQPNQNLESGIWAEYEGAQFLIAHAGNLKFQRAMARGQKPFRRKMEREGSIDPGDQKKILIVALAEAVVLDWKGVKTASGEEAPYSRKMAETALRNDEAFREFVMEFSMEMENFRQEESEHEGNS